MEEKRNAPSARDLVLSGDKLIWHQDVLKRWKAGENFPPIYIEFGPTSYCNHKCIACYVQEAVKKPVTMKESVYKRFMGEIGPFGVKALVLGGCGEPMFHKASTKAIEIAVKGGTDIGILTNGVLIKEKDIHSLMENLTYIRFSASGGSHKSYSTFHRCPEKDWDIVRDKMKKCAEVRENINGKCTLGAYTLVSDLNLNEIVDWVKEIKEIGFDYVILKPPAPGLNRKSFIKQVNLDKINPKLEKILEFNCDDFQVMNRMDLFEQQGSCEREYGECLGLPFMAAVDSDGSVYACNWFWGNKDFCYGNLNEQTFPEIWTGEKRKSILEKVESPEFDFGSCGECRQNNLNKKLWDNKIGKNRLEKPTGKPPAHVNFI